MNYDYSKDEQEILSAIENDELIVSPNRNQIKSNLEKAAESFSKKDRRMNIRMSARDMERLKAKALEEGIPYQTLVSSILHKYVSGKLRED